MPPKAKHEVVQKLVDRIERRDAAALTELFAEDAVLHHPLSPDPVRGRAAIRESEQALFGAFSDIEVEVGRVMVEADDVAIEVTMRATNSGPLELAPGESLPPTGRRIELPSVWFLLLGADGRIIEERDYLDTATFLRQLGLEN